MEKKDLILFGIFIACLLILINLPNFSLNGEPNSIKSNEVEKASESNKAGEIKIPQFSEKLENFNLYFQEQNSTTTIEILNEFTEKNCTGNVCTSSTTLSPRFINQDGNWKLFGNYVDSNFDANEFHFDWNGKGFSMRLEFGYSNDVNYTIAQVKALFPNVVFSDYVQKNDTYHKFWLDINAVPANLRNNLRFIKFYVTEIHGFTLNDVSLDRNNFSISLPDSVTLDYSDLAQNYSLKLLDNRTLLVYDSNAADGNWNSSFSLDPTTTYTFAGITSPSATHKAWYNLTQSDQPPSTVTLTSQTEFSNAEYTNISTDNGITATQASGNGPYATHRFKFKTTDNRNNATKLCARWKGNGYDPLLETYEAKLYIWNGSSYALIGTHTSTTYAYLGTCYTTNLTNYIDSDGNVNIVVQGKWSGSESDVETDFVDMNITTNIAPDVNVLKVDGNLVFNPMSMFSYFRDGNLTIDFNISDLDNNSFLIDLNYSASSVQGTGTVLLDDVNSDGITCDDRDFTNSTRCVWDWNVFGRGDGNYWILAKISDGSSTDFNSSNRSFMVDNNKASTSWDANETQQAFDVNVHLTCVDSFSGCAFTRYRKDTDSSNAVSYGNWLAYDSNVLFTGDGNWALDFNSKDNAGNVGDVNTKYVKILSTLANQSPDMNIIKIDGNLDNQSLPPYSYIRDGNLTIDFNILDPDTNQISFKIDLNISDKNIKGTGTKLLDDWNMMNPPITCDSNNFGIRTTCHYDLNISPTLIGDGNWYILIDVNDSTDTNYESSDKNFMIDNNKPSTSWDGNNNTWQNFDANVHLTCTDGNSGCSSTRYRLDSDSSNTVSYGSWLVYDSNILVFSDGNWAIDFNSTDNVGNVGDVNTKYVLVDKTKPSTSWDANELQQTYDVNVHLTCRDGVSSDANSGCASTRYRKDTDSSNVVSYGSWIAYDSNVLISGDGNWALDFNSTDNAGNVGDVNTFYVRIWVPKSPDVNVLKVDGNLVFNPMSMFSYFRDGNLTIDFNISDLDNNSFLIDLNYSTSSAQGSGVVLLDDVNSDGITCDDRNFIDSTRCVWDWNISGRGDGNYWILVKVSDGSLTDFNFSDRNFMVDNNGPSTSWDGNNNSWQGTDANVHLTCIDSNSGCSSTMYRKDSDSSNVVSYGSWIAYDLNVLFTGDGNWAIDFNSTDNVGNVGDVNTKYVLVDKTKPSTSWDANEVQQAYDVNVHLTCTDANSGCASTRYRKDTDSSNVVSYGSWATYDSNILFNADGNWALDFNSTDLAGNVGDVNTFYVRIWVPKSPDVNVVKIDGNLVFSSMSMFSYVRDGNLTIDFNISDLDNNSFLIDLNYSTSSNQGTGVVLLDDVNSDLISCDDRNFIDSTRCVWDWNVFGRGDGNYWILVKVSDGSLTDFNFSDRNFMVDNNKASTRWDANETQQAFDVNVHLTCVDSYSGCASTRYRKDTDSSNVVSYGSWATYDSNILFNADGNWALDFNSTDLAGNVGDVNTFYVRIWVPKSPDVNVLKVDGNLVFSSMSMFSYFRDGNLTIDFNISDLDNNSFLIDLNYSTSSVQGSGVVLLDDVNSDLISCDDRNFIDSTRCVWDWNVFGRGDGNYWILVKVSDGSLTDFNSSDRNFMVDNNGPSTSWDGNNNSWQGTDANVHLTCVDSYSGCSSTKYRKDSNSSNGVSYGSWIAYDSNVLFTGDGNWAIDFNSTDNAGNVGDVNTKYVLLDLVGPAVSVDYNQTWLNVDVNVHISCSDSKSGCSTTYYRLDSNFSSGVSMGSWLAYDSNVMFKSDGNWRMDFNAVDYNGNYSDLNIVYVLIDTNKPQVSITSPANGSTATARDVSLILDSNDVGGGVASLWYSDDNVSWASNGLSSTVLFNAQPNGNNTYYIKAIDVASNVSVVADINVFVIACISSPEICNGVDDDCDGVADEGCGGGGSKNCAQLSGFVCLSGDVCAGLWLSANDTSYCCSVQCSSNKTCADLSGTVCISDQNCSGSWLNAVDTNSCCSETCVLPCAKSVSCSVTGLSGLDWLVNPGVSSVLNVSVLGFGIPLNDLKNYSLILRNSPVFTSVVAGVPKMVLSQEVVHYMYNAGPTVLASLGRRTDLGIVLAIVLVAVTGFVLIRRGRKPKFQYIGK